MAISIVQSNSGSTGATGGTTIPVSLSTGTTAGNTLVMAISADRYFASPPTGWTQNPNSQNQTFLGQYVYTKVATAGETTWNLTQALTTAVSWVVLEVGGADASAFDVAAAQFAQSSGITYNTANITPTAGERLLIAVFGGSSSGAQLPGVTGWTNSFVELQDVWTTRAPGTGDNNNSSLATRIVAADGSTSYNTGVTWDGGATPQARAAIILSLKSSSSNVPPVADAGPDQVVAINSLVQLDGSGSSDVDGTINGYSWQQISGTPVTLSSDTIVNPTFTAPSTPGALVFGLTVTDSNSETSSQDTVLITVTQTELITAKKIRVGGTWVDKALFTRSGGVWKS